jgi:hypothetical protein
MSFYVLKRDNRRESVHFDKITSRVSKLCYGLNSKVRACASCVPTFGDRFYLRLSSWWPVYLSMCVCVFRVR